ncbi:MAG: methionine--tRNA ligase [Bacilli bacterium]|jgi:methionyl-tRNA synthetase|nr:methionine--tRNA ligase [Acholeplasmataceae bacterium]
MSNKCYITTPIYYSSGRVHIGNSYTTIACDVFARFNRLVGRDTFFLTGMDEHGQKIEEAARAQGLRPQELVDRIALETQKLWQNLHITNDDFIRTSEDRHQVVVQKIFEQLVASGDIYLGKYTGNYCVSCEAYFTKSQLGENNTCPDCGKETKLIAEESYFLRLSKYEQQLLNFIKENPDFIQPESRRNEVISFIESGLEDLSVSRSSFSWGVPVKSDPKHVVYVWIDALSNYLSALGYLSDDDSNYQKYWVNSQRVYHVVGKDILRFHAVYWPIMLMALNVPINFKLMVHGWILSKDGKMSKSRGDVVYPMDVVNDYGVDALRYYVTKELPLGNDGIFSYDRFVERYNTDLANDLGNLLSRTVSMVNKYLGGELRQDPKVVTKYDKELRDLAQKTKDNFYNYLNNFRLQLALNEVWVLINRANKYIDETTPWVLAKDESKKEELYSVMYHLVEVLRFVAVMLSVVLVESAPKMYQALGLKAEDITWDSLEFGKLANIKVIEKIEPLFVRLDPEKEQAKHQKKTEEKVDEVEKKQEITIDDFAKISLVTGEIIDCQLHPDAKKLLVLQVKIGNEVRQIVSGIREYYEPQDLIGKVVVVVENLKEAKIRGLQSKGMILCASKGDRLEVVEVKSLPSGAEVN